MYEREVGRDMLSLYDEVLKVGRKVVTVVTRALTH
jgi:hypothetical protein